MHMLWLALFKGLEQENIFYSLMRDADRLDQLHDLREIDLLVHEGQFVRLRALLRYLGFLALPSWGYAPHHFFIAYDQDLDGWLKLDVVTAVAYGKPIHALRTPLAAACLHNRRRYGPAFGLAPEYELVTLLLHCVLDKGHFAPSRGQRLRALCHLVADETYLSALLSDYWSSTMDGPKLGALIEAENWEALLAERARLAARLSSRDRLGTLVLQAGYRLMRKLNRWAGLVRPQALTVALLAPDGAGKSTLSQGIQASFYFPVRSVYMGLYQKNDASTRQRVPGLSLVIHLCTIWWRYLKARYHQVRGRLVIFDRYIFDALLPPRQRLNWPGRLRRWLLAHACPAPDLVLMLDAPGEVLYARKGEHSATVLEQQRQHYLALRAYLPQMVVVDATRNAEYVRREVMTTIWCGYTTHLNRN